MITIRRSFALFALLGAVALAATSNDASATPPAPQNTYPMHLAFNVIGKNKQMQLNAGIARIEWGKSNGSWSFTIMAAEQDGSAHGLGIVNYTPMCTVRGDREDVNALYDRVAARLRSGAEVICTGSTSAPAMTVVDLKSGQGALTILETP